MTHAWTGAHGRVTPLTLRSHPSAPRCEEKALCVRHGPRGGIYPVATILPG
jgi:hypothetical protein